MDHYSTLGVAKNASDKELKAAYKKASMKHHPDRGGDEAKFKQINEAYSTLKDPHKRGMYDHQQNGGGQGFNFNQQSQGGFEEAMRQANAQYSHPFDHMFNNGFANRTPRNKDLHLRAEIGLADIINGKTLVFQYSTHSGRVETVNVDIPRGAKHGDTVRYQGLGDDGHPGFQRGDLHIKLYVQKVKNWERDQNNLIYKKVINVFDLMLGCVIIVKTLDNKQVKLNIPKGTKIGQVFNIPGYGIPDLHTGKKGNLYVSIDTEIPTITNETILKEIELLKDKIR
jgi:DnaJ-class molecular chaperone